MRIGMVLDQPFPPDIRVEKEAYSLTRAGHEVHLLCVCFGDEPRRVTYNDLTIHRIHLPEQVLRKMRALALSLPIYHWFFERHITKLARIIRLEAIHVHDLPLVRAAIGARRKLHIPVIADLHENYPALLEHARHTRTLLGRLLINIDRWKEDERWACQTADWLVVVADEMRQRFTTMGLRGSNICVVPNAVSPAHLLNQPVAEEITRRLAGRFVVLYIGGLDAQRGLEELIDATVRLQDSIPQLAVVVVGRGVLDGELRAYARNQRLTEVLLFEGWQPYSRLRSYLESAEVCVITHRKTAHTDNTDPNKLYEYLAFAKPVVASNCAALERRIREMNCGMIYPSGNAEKLAECILALHRDPKWAKQLGRNGYQAVARQHNWDVAVQPLLQLYELLEREAHAPVSTSRRDHAS